MDIVLDYAARSDVGLTRSNNQDSAYAGPHLLVIADGMGGHAGGDIASSTCVARLTQLDDDIPSAEDAIDSFETAVDEAHNELLELVQEDPDLAGLGTTITALLRTGNKLILAHIGDSRAYLLRDGELTQITVDHTFVQHLVDTGRLTPEQAERHPQRSLLLRVLGDVDLGTGLDISVREATPGDRWLLCSDGLSGVVSHDTMAQTLIDNESLAEAAEALIQLALRGGAPDNVTCIVADVLDAEKLADGKAPATTPQIVGAAAIDRNRPSRGGGGAAEKAASLTKPEPEPEPEPVWEEVRPRRRRWPWALAAGLLVILAGVVAVFGYQWTQTQYYVGEADGKVAIYRGIDQKLGPIELSSVYSETDIEVSKLAPYMRDRLSTTIAASSLSEAQQIVVTLSAEASP